MSELLRHRHTVDNNSQYGATGRASSRAYPISAHAVPSPDISTRSSLTGYSWPCLDLTIHVGCQYALSMPSLTHSLTHSLKRLRRPSSVVWLATVQAHMVSKF